MAKKREGPAKTKVEEPEPDARGRWVLWPWGLGIVVLVVAACGIAFRKQLTVSRTLGEMGQARITVENGRMKISANDGGFLEAAGLCARKPDWAIEIFRRALNSPSAEMKIQACRMLFYLKDKATVDDYMNVASLCSNESQSRDVRKIAQVSAQEVLVFPAGKEAERLRAFPPGFPRPSEKKDKLIPSAAVKLKGEEYERPDFGDAETFGGWLKEHASEIRWDENVGVFVAGNR